MTVGIVSAEEGFVNFGPLAGLRRGTPLSGSCQQLKISFAAHSSSSEIVLNDEDWHLVPFWNDNRPLTARLNVNKVIAASMMIGPTIELKNAGES